ncbi:MAG: hypothetical protein G01um101418_90 [Parcubacteria group bacterium Gr01-1014_18]|nr:MAG: hypothetical protein Greene041636_394 [Parcubacteria group bacterium Greene0416_36]TSC81417.1 MAG: hypothetical protein G01um101418_90 [Parcubacteria group bacterium Gr01-1014_18]TSC99015.1 MAG: hypothetical protein Greene101420_371 [Parcubacteria group bacterium Greene1014_20]TSD07304.1 MAG: hypothetical protein Greene07142_320 [Parcubacteria group bacterium Greene0714_2]
MATAEENNKNNNAYFRQGLKREEEGTPRPLNWARTRTRVVCIGLEEPEVDLLDIMRTTEDLLLDLLNIIVKNRSL